MQKTTFWPMRKMSSCQCMPHTQREACSELSDFVRSYLVQPVSKIYHRSLPVFCHQSGNVFYHMVGSCIFPVVKLSLQQEMDQVAMYSCTYACSYIYVTMADYMYIPQVYMSVYGGLFTNYFYNFGHNSQQAAHTGSSTQHM